LASPFQGPFRILDRLIEPWRALKAHSLLGCEESRSCRIGSRREYALHVARGKNDDCIMRRHGVRAILQNPVDNIPQSEGQGKQAGFFLKFAAGCVGGGLAQLDFAARKRP